MLPVLAAAAAGWLFLRPKRRNPGRRRNPKHRGRFASEAARREGMTSIRTRRSDMAVQRIIDEVLAEERVRGLGQKYRGRKIVRRRNPRGGTAPDGWHYTLKDNREWNEFQILARSPAGKLSEGRKQFYPYASYDRVSKREARAEAEKALAKMIATGSLINPRRRNPENEISGGKRIGARLQQWHGSAGDPIYVVGSNWYAGRKVGRDYVRDAMRGLQAQLNAGAPEADAKDLRYLIAYLNHRLLRKTRR